MKKVRCSIALLLAVVAVLVVLFVPVSASARGQICGYCNIGTIVTEQRSVFSSKDVSSCAYYRYAHTHTVETRYTVEVCDYCGRERNTYVNWTQEKCSNGAVVG